MDKSIGKVISLVDKLKRWMSLFVLIVMAIIVAASIVELAIVLYQDIFDPTDNVLFLEINELFRIFSFVFIILIGFELMETIEMYFKKNVIHAEVVLLVAVIAVSRKVILLDLEKYNPLAIIGLGFIIVSLGACYYFIRHGYRSKS
jgi:uncharacterized membrane protein (DUF373 family)